MPRPAHHGHRPGCGFGRRRNLQPHMRLARRLQPLRRRGFGAQRRHRVGNRFEHRAGRGIFLDHIAPETLAILIAGGAGQRAHRVAFERVCRGLGRGQPPAHRQIDEFCFHPMPHRPARRLVFRREFREGPERGALRLIRRIGQQCHRRHHIRMRQHRQQSRGIRRPLDEHAAGAQLLQCREQPPRRARPVMPDAEQMNAGHAHTRPDRA